MKFPLHLRRHEYDTLLLLTGTMVESGKKYHGDMTDKLLLVLMAKIYARLYAKSLITQDRYTFLLPIEEAMAFHAFWTSTPVANVVGSHLINKIIADIDKKFA